MTEDEARISGFMGKSLCVVAPEGWVSRGLGRDLGLGGQDCQAEVRVFNRKTSGPTGCE